MMFVQRDQSGKITAVFANAQPGYAEEELSDSDDEILAYINQKPAPIDQIRELEQRQLMPRATREFMLLSMESQFTPEQLAMNPGYSAVKAFDNSIADLRAQL